MRIYHLESNLGKMSTRLMGLQTILTCTNPDHLSLAWIHLTKQIYKVCRSMSLIDMELDNLNEKINK